MFPSLVFPSFTFPNFMFPNRMFPSLVSPLWRRGALSVVCMQFLELIIYEKFSQVSDSFSSLSNSLVVNLKVLYSYPSGTLLSQSSFLQTHQTLLDIIIRSTTSPELTLHQFLD